MVKMVVFLGNPGQQYEKTRHNTAQMFMSYMKLEGDVRNKFNSSYVKTGDVIYLKPGSYMNVCGSEIFRFADFFKVFPQNMLVVHDDLELKFGQTKLQSGGGLGGHNGLRSVRQFFGTQSFARLRIGIGRPVHPEEDVSSFVLGRFTPEEEKNLDGIFLNARTLLEEFV